jgi:hypothetical protein
MWFPCLATTALVPSLAVTRRLDSFEKQGDRPVPACCCSTLLVIGAAAFGGLGATLALLRPELVERRGWLRPSDITEALAYTKPLPGSTVVQVVWFSRVVR